MPPAAPSHPGPVPSPAAPRSAALHRGNISLPLGHPFAPSTHHPETARPHRAARFPRVLWKAEAGCHAQKPCSTGRAPWPPAPPYHPVPTHQPRRNHGGSGRPSLARSHHHGQQHIYYWPSTDHFSPSDAQLANKLGEVTRAQRRGDPLLTRPGWDPAPKGCCSHTALHPSLNRALFTPSNSKTSMHPQPVCVGPTVRCVVAGAHPQAGTSHIRDQLQAWAEDKDMVHKDLRRQRQGHSSSHCPTGTPRASLPPPGFHYQHFPRFTSNLHPPASLPPSLPPPAPSFAPTGRKRHGTRSPSPRDEQRPMLPPCPLTETGAGAAWPPPAIPARQCVPNHASSSVPAGQRRWV